MGRPGSALDNAVIESWHSTVEFELLRQHHFATKAQARAVVPALTDECNQDRRHLALNMMAPIEFELAYPELAHRPRDKDPPGPRRGEVPT
jgi:transposase InsO family protein